MHARLKGNWYQGERKVMPGWRGIDTRVKGRWSQAERELMSGWKELDARPEGIWCQTICLVAVGEVFADTLVQLLSPHRSLLELQWGLYQGSCFSHATHDSRLWNHEQPVHVSTPNFILEWKALHTSPSCSCSDKTAC